jgi:hypothetical protein
MLRHVSALTVGHLQGARKFLARVASVVRILHMIKIIIVKIERYSS